MKQNHIWRHLRTEKPILRTILVLLITLFSVSCTRKVYVPVESSHVDTLFQYKVQKDSLYFRDSVMLEYKTVGDTVFTTKYVTKWRDRVRLHTDTVYRSRTDTITKVQTVEVEKKTGIIDKLRSFGLSVVAIIVIALFIILYRDRSR